MGNNAIYVNHPFPADEHITSRGSDWLWAVCAIMGTGAAAFAAWAATRPRQDRVFYYINTAICLTACIAYYSIAGNLGYTPIDVEFQRSDPKVAGITRQVFYARYIDWFVTTPLLLLDLLLTAGVNWWTIAFTIYLDIVMIVTGLMGALTASSYKWGFWTAGMVAFFGIVYELIFVGRKNANLIGADVGKAYMTSTGLLLLLWFLYPIAWALAEGGNVISSDSEAIFYGVLDVLAKPVFGALILFTHRNIDLSRLGLIGRDRFAAGSGPTKISTSATA